MKKTITTILALLALAPLTVNAITLNRVSIHDPSVVYNPGDQYYYIFGTHRGLARTKNMMNWSGTTYNFKYKDAGGAAKVINNIQSGANAYKPVFETNYTTTVTVGGAEKTFGNFDAFAWSNASAANYEIGGNMWAPDVVYNKKMQKWCLYFSINGDKWKSSIVLLTASNINGPYEYQGPVVFSGFEAASSANFSYKKTDLELALGTLSSLPSRYTAYWGNRWPNCIDPCVFYDEEGKLWMTYGSWSGGIWMLQLNEDNGLRDYDVKYNIAGSGDGVTSDPYFGKKIAGGFYVSGEGSYIKHIGDYYYLFVTYGFMLSAENGTNDQKKQGGYQMRVFRSTTPDGPYKDNRNQNAIFTGGATNYGPKDNTHRGINIFGAYSDWGGMTKGEREQGHNSVVNGEDGRSYLIYHTRFQDPVIPQGHAVRVHQLFVNKDGWLVAAPFEYTGETVKTADIATTQQVATADIPGTYKLMIHKYGLNYVWGAQETVTPVDVTLHADGTISGSRTGTWSVEEGTSYVSMNIGGAVYNGVMVDQVIEPNTANSNINFTATAKNKTKAFTGLATSGVTAWAYRTGDDPTAVNGVISRPAAGIWFDLQGRRITTPQKGSIYIQNGKKYINK